MLSLQEYSKQIADDYVAIRRRLHENPELAFEEHETCRLIADELYSYGIEPQTNGDQTGVVGVLNGVSQGKTVAIRADIDALPISERTGLSFESRNAGVCHACGHDIHTAAALMAARILSHYRDFLHGTVKFIFQPAEETLQGAQTVIQSGFLENPHVDMIFGLHTWPNLPVGCIGIRRGPMMAGSDRFCITIRAAGGHAAHPHKTSDPIVVAAFLITQLQTIVSRQLNPLESAVITVGKLTAGSAANIIPSEAKLEGTIRFLTQDVEESIQQSVRRIAVLTAQSMRAEAEVEFYPGTPPLIPDCTAVDIIEEAACHLLGRKCVQLLDTVSMGSEDFACYLRAVPGAFFRIGTQDERPETRFGLHDPRLLFHEKSIEVGALTLCGAVYRYTEGCLLPQIINDLEHT